MLSDGQSFLIYVNYRKLKRNTVFFAKKRLKDVYSKVLSDHIKTLFLMETGRLDDFLYK